MAVIKPIPPRGCHKGKFFNVSEHLILSWWVPWRRRKLPILSSTQSMSTVWWSTPRRTLIKEKKKSWITAHEVNTISLVQWRRQDCSAHAKGVLMLLMLQILDLEPEYRLENTVLHVGSYKVLADSCLEKYIHLTYSSATCY